MDGIDEEFLFGNFDSPATEVEAEEDVSKAKRTKKQAKKNSDEDTEESLDGSNNAQNRYISELEQQNAKLKSIIKRMIGPQLFSLNDEQSTNETPGEGEIDLIQKLEDEIQSKPFAVVLYLNNDLSNVHRKEIDEVMKNISAKKATQEVLMAHKLQAQNSAVPLKAFTSNCKGKRCNLGKVKDVEEQYIVCACQYYKSFFVDRMGAPLLDSNPAITDIWDVPSYQQLYLKALPIVEEALNVRVKFLKHCFNCGGDHHLNKCTQPRDMQRINLSRQQHSASKFKSPAGYDSRYHANDEELDERFKHFKPGQISVGLEEALSISLKKHLPPYIYKMRELGYPPGWMRPADEGLKMYGAEGNILDEPGVEEGEIKPIQLPDVISYPGYNTPLPEDVEDQYRKMDMLPFQPELADLDIAKKRAQALGFVDGTPIAKRLKYEESDMEIDSGDTDGETGQPPLPLIKVTSDSLRPPLPTEQKENSNGLVTIKTESDDGQPSVKETANSTPLKSGTKPDGSVSLPRVAKSKQIDETTYRSWYIHQPLTSVGITYVMYTPPPTCRGVVDLSNLPKNPIFDLDREPWKTASASWYDPLYGDLAAPIGTFDAIKTLLKDTKRVKRKPLKSF